MNLKFLASFDIHHNIVQLTWYKINLKFLSIVFWIRGSAWKNDLKYLYIMMNLQSITMILEITSWELFL